MKPPAKKSATVIGLGLIGGSLALALRRRGYSITGYDRSRATLALARRRGALTAFAKSAGEAVSGARLVVICIPVQFLPECLREIVRRVPPDSVVTDTASVKAPVARLAGRLLPSPGRFVGGHPMAGGERHGFTNARADLFRRRTVALTPVSSTGARALAVVRGMWREAGARVVAMSPARHDIAAARISHLPHLLAYALVPALADRDCRRLVSGSFLDATRVAASDPALWEGIVLANRRAVGAAAQEHARRMARLLALARRGDGRDLRRAFGRAAELRLSVGRRD